MADISGCSLRTYSSYLGTQAWSACTDGNDGAPAGNRFGVIRPVLSESRHFAARRFRQSDRVTAPETTEESGNSVFLDDKFVPFPDQWAYLCSIRSIDHRAVEGLSEAPKQRDTSLVFSSHQTTKTMYRLGAAPPSRRRANGVITGPLPEQMELVLGNQIYIAKDKLSPSLRNRLIRLAAFQNPEFYKAQAMRLPTYEKPRIIACAEDHPKHIGLPRGCLDDLLRLLSGLKIKSSIRDERNSGRSFEARFQGDLRPGQQIAAEAMLAHDTGVLSATTAFGKTVVAAWLIAKRGVNALILVHRRQLQSNGSTGYPRSLDCRRGLSAESAAEGED